MTLPFEARTITEGRAARRFRLPYGGCPSSVNQDASRSPTVGRCEDRCLKPEVVFLPGPQRMGGFSRVPEPVGCVEPVPCFSQRGFSRDVICVIFPAQVIIIGELPHCAFRPSFGPQ